METKALLTCIKEFIFGRKSRQNEIELEWKRKENEVKKKYNALLKNLEYDKMQEIGFPSENAPKTIDEKVKRLESLDRKINEAYDEMFAAEDVLWVDKMKKLRQDQFDSSCLLGRIWLWMYWHF